MKESRCAICDCYNCICGKAEERMADALEGILAVLTDIRDLMRK